MAGNKTYEDPLSENHALHLNLLVPAFSVLIIILLATFCFIQQQRIYGLQETVAEQTINAAVQEKVLAAWKNGCKKNP
ncbi:MAG: hypothetical protein WC813_04040 [Patescibacteria group bacterium]|jgi:hypothetical protein